MMISKKIVVSGIVLLALVFAATQALRLYRQPLGPALELPTSTQPATLTRFPFKPVAANVTATETLPVATQTSTPKPMCGGPAVMNLLAIGSDSRGKNYMYGLSDVMRLVRADFVNARVTILEVPRDLWVEIPEISDHYNITHGKLNQSYLYGNKGLGYYDGPGEGPGLLARTLNLNFGAQPDHYIAVNMKTFEAIVDAIGGVDVYLPYDVKVFNSQYPDGYGVEEGQHHFDGQTALWVARIRQYGTFSRAENQNIIMCALRKKLLSPALIPAIPQLVKDFQQYVQTDLSAEQINQLACLATQMHGTDVVFASFPKELFKVNKTFDPQLGTTTSTLDAEFPVLRSYVDQFQAGTWPDPNLIINNTPSPAATDLEFACED